MSLDLPNDELAAMDDRYPEMIEMMMRGHTMKAIATRFDVSERTVYRWKTSDLGTTLLSSAKREAIDRAHRAVASSTAVAAATLNEVAGDKKAKRSDRVAAARAILQASGMEHLAGSLFEDGVSDVRQSAEISLTAKLDHLAASLDRPVIEPASPGALRAVGE